MDKNSLLYWFPKLQGISAPQPETAIVEIPEHILISAIDDLPVLDDYLGKILSAAEVVGYPLFLRSDQASGKHDWLQSCFVQSSNELLGRILSTVEFNAMAGMLGLRMLAMVFRKYIEMDSAFVAFGGTPISRERRYFVRDGEVICHHPYWPEEAIEFWDWRGVRETDGWREALAAISIEDQEEVEGLSAYAVEISERLPGHWSVDFCRSAEGVWYFIDMAEAGQSWHPECSCTVEHFDGKQTSESEEVTP